MQQEAHLWSGLVTASYCFLCEKNLQGVNQAIGHAASRLHKENVTCMKTHVFNYFICCSQPRSSSFYCFVCRCYFTSKQLLLDHVAAFPHNVLAKIKSNLVKEEIREEFAFSAEMGNYIDCVICNVNLYSQVSANQHLNSSAHKRALSTWKKHLPKHVQGISMIESRYFYCKVCYEALDGTTEAVRHYRKHERTAHLATIEWNSGTPPVNTNNVSKVSVQQTATKVTFSPAVASKNSTKPKDNISENKNILLPEKCEDNNADSQLKQAVFEQMEKLIQTLYYSKKVPYEVSLQYLKKVNKQVEDIVKKHKSEKSKDEPQINALSKSSSCASTETFLSANSSREVLVDIPPPPKLCVASSKTTRSENAQLKVTNSLPVQKETVPAKVISNDATVEKSISNLLADVVKRKLEVKQQNKDDVEIQVLDEMEILLTEICKEKAPLTEILKCLEQFNKELDDVQLSGVVQVETGGELVSDQKPLQEELKKTDPAFLDGKEDQTNNLSSQPSVQDVITSNTEETIPSLEDTNTELITSGPPKLTYTKKELLNLRFGGNKAKHICIGLEMIGLLVKCKVGKLTISCFSNLIHDLLECPLVNQKNSLVPQTNLSLPATTKNQLTTTIEPVLGVKNFGCEFNSFYDYYTGSDFEAFMEFRTQYLYGSIEESPNENEPNSICESQVSEEPNVNVQLEDCYNTVYDY